MSKYRHFFSNILKGLIYDMGIPFFLLLFLLFSPAATNFSHANDFSSRSYQLTYEKNLISISATKADLKSILIDVSERADISIQYPASLDKKISIKIKDISLKKALIRLLKDYNYSIIYSGSKKRAVISEVYILDKNKKSPRISSNNTRIISRIKYNEKRIESLKKSLSRVSEDSTSGKRYINRIKSYEKNIENLKNQLE